MSIDTTFLRRCIQTLELALDELGRRIEADDVIYDIYRAACVKEFELVLEQSGKLLRKRLALGTLHDCHLCKARSRRR